jgi:SAM-dependent methyltransferase
MTMNALNGVRTISDVDFGQLYRNHMAIAGGKAKPAECWDRRANMLDRRIRLNDHYVSDFVGRVDAADCATLLDVGCGTGAIAVALSRKLDRVFALDYSESMLQHVRHNAELAGATNIYPIHRAWDDDWDDVPACDLVIASRSTAVMDLERALTKLDSKASRRVYMTSFVGGRMINRAIADALGITVPATIDKPDYIYAVNLLYRMGRRPRLDYIARDKKEDDRRDLDGFRQNVEFALGPIGEAAWLRLRAWRDVNPTAPLFERDQDYWAFISWDID